MIYRSTSRPCVHSPSRGSSSGTKGAVCRWRRNRQQRRLLRARADSRAIVARLAARGHLYNATSCGDAKAERFASSSPSQLLGARSSGRGLIDGDQIARPRQRRTQRCIVSPEHYKTDSVPRSVANRSWKDVGKDVVFFQLTVTCAHTGVQRRWTIGNNNVR